MGKTKRVICYFDVVVGHYQTSFADLLSHAQFLIFLSTCKLFWNLSIKWIPFPVLKLFKFDIQKSAAEIKAVIHQQSDCWQRIFYKSGELVNQPPWKESLRLFFVFVFYWKSTIRLRVFFQTIHLPAGLTNFCFDWISIDVDDLNHIWQVLTNRIDSSNHVQPLLEDDSLEPETHAQWQFARSPLQSLQVKNP